VKCRHARKIIAEHLARDDHDVPDELTAHLADCARCAGLWHEQVRIHTALTDVGAAPAPAAPADLAQRAHRRLLEGERIPPAPLRVVLVYASLAAVVAIGAIAIFTNRARLPGGTAPYVARVDPVRGAVRHAASDRRPASDRDEQPVPHDKTPSPGGTGNSLPVSPRPAEDARVDQQPVPPESDQIDLLIIVWAPPAVTTDEQRIPENNWRPHTDLLSPRSADVVARTTLVASPVRSPHPSAEPSVPSVRSAIFAALPVQSMDVVAELTSVPADTELPETESPPDPASSDVTTAPEPVMIVDSLSSGGEDDEQPCEPEILLCVHDGDDPVLLCGELGLGGGGLI